MFNTQLSNEINVTPEAVKQLVALTENEDGVNGVRIFVSGGGCSGMTYGMTFAIMFYVAKERIWHLPWFYF